MSEERKYTIEDIVRKFIGPTEPLGCSHGDKERLENTAQIAEMVETLTQELVDLARYKDDYRDSMSAIGKKAQLSIDEIREIIGGES